MYASCRRPFVYHDVDAVVLHGRVQVLLHHGRETVNFVDEQNIARRENILFGSDLHRVVLLKGIKNFNGRVPVRWKVNGIPVVIQADSLNLGIFDLLTDSVEVRIKFFKSGGIVAV